MSSYARCGEDCLVPGEEDATRPLSASARAEASWVLGERVVRQIAARSQEPGHPFNLPELGGTIEQRAGCLELLAREPLPHVLPVTRVCRCSFESPFIDGRPFQDFGLGNDAKRLIHPAERRIERPAAVTARLLAQLARGLGAMHLRGVAHGDPALLNVMVVEREGGSSAIWVDLNSVRPATEDAIAVDTAAFVVSTLWPALLDTRTHSPSLFGDLVRAVAEEEDVLLGVAKALELERSDHSDGSAVETLQSSLWSTSRARTDRVGTAQHRIASVMASMYFLLYTRSDQDVRFLQVALATERTRHSLLEEETSRLHYLRFKGELDRANAAIAELKQYVDKQREAIDFHSQRGDRTEKTLAELNEYCQKQREAIEYHSQRGDRAEKTLAELRSQIENQQKATARRVGWRSRFNRK